MNNLINNVHQEEQGSKGVHALKEVFDVSVNETISTKDFVVATASSFKSKDPKITEFFEHQRRLLASEKFLLYAKAIRNCEDKKQKTMLKSRLPVFIFGSLMQGGLSGDHVVTNLPHLFLDIDLESEEEAVTVKKLVTDLLGSYSFYISFSISKKGVHAVIYTGDTENINEKYNALVALLKKHNVEVDKSTKDIATRKKFADDDPEPFLNAKPIAFDERLSPKKEVKVLPLKVLNTATPTQAMTVQDLHTQLQDEGIVPGDGLNHDYSFTLGTRANKLGLKKEDVIAFLINHIGFTHDSEHVGRIEYIYTKYASQFGVYNKQELEIVQVEAFINEHYVIVRNVVKGQLQYKEEGGLKLKDFEDEQLLSIHRHLEHSGFKMSVQRLRNLLYSDFTPSINPFGKYLHKVHKSGYHGDPIKDLANTVKTTDKDFFYYCFKKWFVGVVACMYDESAINHQVLVLSGKQGVGKTTWMRNLVPTALGANYSNTGTIDPNHKDSQIKVAEMMLIILDELDNLNKSSLNSLKQLITIDSVSLRRAYGYFTQTLPRRASFCGTINDPEFLSDPTGNRRFLCFEALHIDYSKFDMDSAYAQAFDEYKKGFKYWFEGEDIDRVNESNKRYEKKMIEEEKLLEIFEPCTPEDVGIEFMTSTKIAEAICWIDDKRSLTVNNTLVQNVGRMLNKHKFLRTKRKGRYGYLVKRRDFDDTPPSLSSLFEV